MIKTADHIKKILSDKKVTFIILALSLFSRIIQLVFFFNIRVDCSFQVIGTKNFVDGHSISMDNVLPTDLSTIIYDPLVQWPPGYSVLLAPLYLLFGKNYIVAGLTLSILAGVTLLLVTRGILKLLNIPIYFINIYTLVAGFFIYYFYFIASSDAVAIPFFFIALYYTIALLQKNDRWKKRTIFIIICLFIFGVIKYLFVPVAFIIPVFLFLKGYADKQASLRKAGLVSFLSLAVLFGSMLAYQQYVSGSVGYISATGRGFYPEHLLSEYPFIPSSFIRSETIGTLIPGSSIESYIYHIFQWLQVLLLLVFAFFVLRHFFQEGLKGMNIAGSYFYILFFSSITITAVLAVLSLFVEAEFWENGYRWTYIEDQRYYGVLFVLLQMGVFIAYTYYRTTKKVSKYIYCILFVLLFTEIGRGITLTSKRVLHFQKEEYSWQYDNRFQKFAEDIIKPERGKRVIAIGGTSRYFNFRTCIYSHVPIMNDLMKINDLSSINTKTPAMLLVLLHKKDLASFQPFLASKEKLFAGNFNDIYFYKVYVDPH